MLRRLWLTQTVQSDLVLLDVPLPDGTEAEPFYTTLLRLFTPKSVPVGNVEC